LDDGQWVEFWRSTHVTALGYVSFVGRSAGTPVGEGIWFGGKSVPVKGVDAAAPRNPSTLPTAAILVPNQPPQHTVFGLENAGVSR
jgi:hypothetical protein